LLAEFGHVVATEQQLRRLLSEREHNEQQLRHDSLHDPLTGLPNRALFMKRLADATQRARRGEDGMFAVVIGGYDHATSASIGVALSTGANEQPEYVLRSADIAMYRAKNAGRGRYEMFDRAMHAEALTRLQIESDLRHAFERNEFRPVSRGASGSSATRRSGRSPCP
jgi:PleD family two-component response regulator